MSYKNYSNQVINHLVRKSLELSCDEYCLLLHVYDVCDAKKSKYLSFTRNFAAHTEKHLTFSTTKQIEILRSLIEKGFLSRTKVDNRFIRERQSIQPFEENKDEFEEIWIFSKRVGNKKKATDAYKVTIRYFDHEFLMKRMKFYLEHLEIVKHSQLHLSTWLNNDTQEFMNHYKSEKTNEAGKGNFFT
jgi:hypothetical protein